MAKSKYSLYLNKVLFPVAPESVKIKVNNKNETVELINDGEVNILKTPGLTEISFDVLLPNQKYPFSRYVNGFVAAAYYIEVLEALKTGKKNFQFILTRIAPSGKLLFDTNITVSLEDYEVSDEVENGMDIMVSISLKQYRQYGTTVVKVKKTKSGKLKIGKVLARNGKRTVPKTYTVVKGSKLNTLSKIVKYFYGDTDYLKKIQKNNKITKPNKLKVGKVIKLI